MGWSSWITSAPEQGASGEIRRAQTLSEGYDTNADPDTALANAYAEARTGTGPRFETNVVGSALDSNAGQHDFVVNDTVVPGNHNAQSTLTQHVRWFDASEFDVASYRNWNPPELSDLTYGVDYTEIPAELRQSEDDVYVQYDAGSTVFVGWKGTGSVTISAGDGEALVVLTTATALPPEVPATAFDSVATTPFLVDPSSIPIVLSVNGPVGTSSGTVDFSANLAGLAAFQLAALTRTTPGYVDQGGGTYNSEWQISPLDYTAYLLLQLPRWRYWTLREPVLRWKQRDDGLGMSSTPAWRGSQSQSTSQGAARWRGLT